MSGPDGTFDDPGAPAGGVPPVGAGDPGGPGAPIGPDEPGGPGGSGRRNLVIGLGAVLAALVVVLVVVLVTRDDDEDVTTTASSTTAQTTSTTAAGTSSTTSTTGSTTSTTGATTSTTAGGGGITDAEAATVVWPDPGGSTSYTEPLDAARSFAVDLIGFTDPVIGEYQGGDSRSGEFEVRARADGPVTTVFVRMMSDDHWYVLGAVTPEIEVTSPDSGADISSPVTVTGQARAYEGTVRVAVYGWGRSQPLGEGFVTGSGGPDLGPFSGNVTFDDPGAGRGSLVFTIASAEDGSIWQAAAMPVGFTGG